MYLTQGLHRAVQRMPGQTATVCGDRTRTYQESADRVARLAGALRRLGVGDSDRVAMLSLNSDRYHEYFLAVWWIGGVITPANIRWSPAEIAYALTDSGTRVLLVDDTFAPMTGELRDRCPELATVIHCGDAATPDGMLAYEDLVDGAQPADDVRRGGDALAGIFYTGGTTGFPKGVMLSHANMITSALGATVTGISPPDGTLLHAAPMFHLADIAMWMGLNCGGGGTHVMIPAFEPVAVMAAIQAHQITTVILVPTMIQLLVDHPRLGDYELSSVQTISYGASPMPLAVLERALKAFPGAEFRQAYGMTELAPIATVLSPGEHRDGRCLRSAGQAAPHAEVRVVGEDDREVPRGTVGEIVVRGGHVMLGYWNKPGETAAAVRGGWMHTGDGGYMDDEGYLYIVDRMKDMIISGGENVYSTEVENAVAQHPAVAACAVVGVPDEDWGERVHAVIVRRPGGTVTAAEIREHCKTLIAGYKAPRSCEFADALPVSGAGKILKRELRAKYE